MSTCNHPVGLANTRIPTGYYGLGYWLNSHNERKLCCSSKSIMKASTKIGPSRGEVTVNRKCIFVDSLLAKYIGLRSNCNNY